MALDLLHSFICVFQVPTTRGCYVASWGPPKEQDRRGVPGLLQGCLVNQECTVSTEAPVCAVGGGEAAPAGDIGERA